MREADALLESELELVVVRIVLLLSLEAVAETSTTAMQQCSHVRG